MNQITISYHLLIPAIISIGALIILLNKRVTIVKKYNKSLWISLVVFLFLYSVIVTKNTFDSFYYQWDLITYDLNKDGFFSGEELTEEQGVAMRRLTNDASRNFSIITGLLLSILVSLPVYLVSLMIDKLKSKDKILYQQKHSNI